MEIINFPTPAERFSRIATRAEDEIEKSRNAIIFRDPDKANIHLLKGRQLIEKLKKIKIRNEDLQDFQWRLGIRVEELEEIAGRSKSQS